MTPTPFPLPKDRLERLTDPLRGLEVQAMATELLALRSRVEDLDALGEMVEDRDRALELAWAAVLTYVPGDTCHDLADAIHGAVDKHARSEHADILANLAVAALLRNCCCDMSKSPEENGRPAADTVSAFIGRLAENLSDSA